MGLSLSCGGVLSVRTANGQSAAASSVPRVHAYARFAWQQPTYGWRGSLSACCSSVSTGWSWQVAPADEAFVRNVMEPAVMRFEGNALPVSRFSDNIGGVMKPGTTKYEKRRISEQVPEWLEDKCVPTPSCL
jgi:hypothetical protein